MKMSLKYTVLCLGIFLSALQVQAQVASEGEPEKKGEMFREVPNPEKMAQKETDRLKEALNLTDKQYKKVYKLILKEQRELLENRMQRPPMMGQMVGGLVRLMREECHPWAWEKVLLTVCTVHL